MKKLVSITAVLMLASIVFGASASDIDIFFSTSSVLASSGDHVTAYAVDYTGPVKIRAEIPNENDFYNDWMANSVYMEVKCKFYPAQGFMLQSQPMKIGCRDLGGGRKECTRYLVFDAGPNDLHGGRAECFVNDNLAFSSTIPFAQAQPPTPPQPQPECTQDAGCGQGEICVADECIAGCRNDGDCASGEECVANQCRQIQTQQPITQPSQPPTVQPNVTTGQQPAPPSSQPPAQQQAQGGEGKLPCVSSYAILLLAGLFCLKR